MINLLFRSLCSTAQRKIVALSLLTITTLFAGQAKAASPGVLDFSFGTRGTAAFNLGDVYLTCNAIVVQADGKVVAVGSARGPCIGAACDDFLLVRFNANGTLDTGFGTNGVVITDFSAQYERIYAAAIQADGKIVVAGSGLLGSPSATNVFGFKLVRYLSNGALDTTFGTGGRVFESFLDQGGMPHSMFIQPDGKIVVSGTDNSSILFAARFDTSGGLDSGFGTNGRIVSSDYNVSLVDMARQSDGKIIIAGRSSPTATVKLIRFNVDGTPDSNFGMGGVLNVTFGLSLDPVIAVQTDDKILLSGTYSFNHIGIRVTPLKRFNADGGVDNSFTPNHGLEVDGACLSCVQKVSKILLLPDGRFYLAGTRLNVGLLVASVSRYLSNGTLDSSFGFRGTSVFKHVNANGILYSFADAALQPDGKVIVVGDGTTTQGNPAPRNLLATRLTSNVTPPSMQGDFDGDRKTDFAVFRPSSGYWYSLNSSDGSFYYEPFGTQGDVTVPGDYNYDLKTDVSVHRPNNNGWYVLNSLPAGGGPSNSLFGQTGEVRVPEDFDGDGYTDWAVFRPSDGTWTVRYSSLALTNPIPLAEVTLHFGLGTDKPVPGDYDSDGRADFAVFRPSTGAWYVLRSSDGIVTAVNFGLGTDKAVQGDYDGDLKTDVAVFRDGAWYILRSSDGGFIGIGWGVAGDKPVPGDYDGDGKFDVAVYRPSVGTWYVLKSSDSSMIAQQWGVSDDNPVPFSFVR